MHLTIGWLYPTRMNIYGDRGNVVALQRRSEWRGIDVQIRHIDIGDAVPPDVDIFFFGGGQDQAQVAVSRDLIGAKAKALRTAVEDGAALLSVCGGYQLLGHEYRPHGADPLPGIGLFDVESVAGAERFIGNVIVDSQWGELVGFENHSGLTYLKGAAQPMGRVRAGRGNNGQDGTEGVIYRHAIGCYLHGSLLPKNPALTDWLIAKGLDRRGLALPDVELDDHFERSARASAISRAARTT